MASSKFKFFSSIWDLIATTRERRRYENLLNDPEQRKTSKRYGKKFIACATITVILSALALLFAYLSMRLADSMGTLTIAVGFEFILYIVCFVLTLLLIFYALLFFLSRLKYIKWQRTLNNNQIAKKAKIYAIVSIIITVAISVAAIVLILKPLM